MHVSDGFLEVPVIAATTVASVGILSVVAKRTPAAELTSPMVGASAAFVIAAQMVNFPVAASVSGHIIGGVLVAILLGWRVSVLVMTAVLVIQAMLFQDGGIAALGANVLNLAIVGPGLGYLVYLGIRGGIVEGRERAWTYRDSVAAFLAGWTASVVAALLVAVELWLSGQAELKIIMLLMLSIHALIGIAEGGATVLIARFLAHQQQCADCSQVPRGNCS